jgi:queuine tRNA-ribosyltransferase
MPLKSAPLRYELLKADAATGARLGSVTTLHGSFDTPAFMPVGTQGSIKGLTPDQVAATGAQIVLANTYHLMLRPGERVVAELGGLHKFMGWPGPILTDSGGFQVFSLADINRVTDQGVVFKSHINGDMVDLTPERSMEVQNALGADIIMAFDQCPAAGVSPEEHERAVARTVTWARRCIKAHGRAEEQSLFGIVQGGTDVNLRRKCAAELMELDFPGYAVGGLAVGESFDEMVRILTDLTPILPPDRPRYLMGVGYPRDILAAVGCGVDMFDCVLPTRNGRNAFAFTSGGALRLRNRQYMRDKGPIEAGCDCYACANFSRGAIRHYFFAGEMLGPMLVSAHNIRFYQRLMAEIRGAIGAGTFGELCRSDARRLLEPADNGKETNT